jgi:hypothetical protein
VPRQELSTTSSGFDEGWALIIGVANYLHMRHLPRTVIRDACDFAKLLQDPAYAGYSSDQVRLLLDQEATATAIRDGMCWLAQATGTALVYFSGHGGRIDTGREARNYLIPYDCLPADLAGTAIEGRELTDLLREVRAERVIVFLDSCHSGGAAEPKGLISDRPDLKSGLDEAYYERLAQGVGRVVIASCRADEVSWVLQELPNSVFTYYLLQALRGKASTSGDGLIRVFDVFNYLSEAIPRHVEQHPIFRATDLENNFPISLYLGGRKTVPYASIPVSPETLAHSTQVSASRFEDVNETRLLDLMLETCSPTDINLLAFRLGISYDDLPGETLTDKNISLLQRAKRERRLADLVRVLCERKPFLADELSAYSD